MNCDSIVYGRPRKASLLECSRVSLAYGRETVLYHVTLCIDEADFVWVIGPNGCGKSTLIKILSVVLSPRKGTVSICGRDMAGLTRRRAAKQPAVVAQEETADFGFTIQEEIILGRAPHHGGLHFENRADRNPVTGAPRMTPVGRLDNLDGRRI